MKNSLPLKFILKFLIINQLGVLYATAMGTIFYFSGLL
jgi:hypothetical protein